METNRHSDDSPESLARGAFFILGFVPCFWGTIATILAVLGIPLYPLIGLEAFYPAQMFLDANAIAQILTVSVVSGTILLSIAGLWRKYEDEKTRGHTRSFEEFLVARADPTWVPVLLTHVRERQEIQVRHQETPIPAENERTSEESLTTAHATTSVARGLQ